MRHVLIMFDTRVTQAAPADAGGPLSPGQAVHTAIRPDINCLILSDQLIFEDLLTQTHEVQETSVSCESRVEMQSHIGPGGGRGGKPPQSQLRLVTDHISPKLPQPSTLRVSLVTKTKFHAETTSFIGAGN